MSGLSVHVLRHANWPDCSNEGVSSKHERLIVTNVPGPFEPSEDCPAVRLEMHVRGCLRLVPVVPDPHPWFQFGGNYAASSDSRMRAACERLLGHPFYGAIAIHDRVET